mmetsp:Transcript_17251/g.35048  ORF Transcript_17251/g.35048 Transcript_17251/m.35048 type:complete len:417 (-) Transcript_17251:374-1624(-)
MTHVRVHEALASELHARGGVDLETHGCGVGHAPADGVDGLRHLAALRRAHQVTHEGAALPGGRLERDDALRVVVAPADGEAEGLGGDLGPVAPLVVVDHVLVEVGGRHLLAERRDQLPAEHRLEMVHALRVLGAHLGQVLHGAAEHRLLRRDERGAERALRRREGLAQLGPLGGHLLRLQPEQQRDVGQAEHRAHALARLRHRHQPLPRLGRALLTIALGGRLALGRGLAALDGRVLGARLDGTLLEEWQHGHEELPLGQRGVEVEPVASAAVGARDGGGLEDGEDLDAEVGIHPLAPAAQAARGGERGLRLRVAARRGAPLRLTVDLEGEQRGRRRGELLQRPGERGVQWRLGHGLRAGRLPRRAHDLARASAAMQPHPVGAVVGAREDRELPRHLEPPEELIDARDDLGFRLAE